MTGVVFWVVVMAVWLAQPWWRCSEVGRIWSRALHRGAWLVAIWTMAGGLVAVLLSGCRGIWTWLFVPLMLGLGAEFASGVAMVGAVEWLGQQVGRPATASVDAYSWTLLITVMQGAAVLMLVGLAAAGWRGLSWGRTRWRRWRGSRSA